MSHNPLVSIVVPVYKAEAFIAKCIDSLLAQTYTNIEILLVDDGSPDRSGEVCDAYATKDKRIRVFHKPNEGVSSARNMGLAHLMGELLLFVDADDTLSHDCVEQCVRVREQNDLDLLQFSFAREEEALGKSEGVSTPVSDLKSYLANNKLHLSGGANLYKTSIIKEHDIRFDTHLKLAEDQLFNYQYMLRCSKLQHIPQQMYYYYFNPVGVSNRNPLLPMCESTKVLADFKVAHPEFTNCIDRTTAEYVGFALKTYPFSDMPLIKRLFVDARLTVNESLPSKYRMLVRLLSIHFYTMATLLMPPSKLLKMLGILK